MNKRHRTFIAINLPNDLKKELVRYQKKWADLPAKWTNIENLHSTLVFLGDLTDIELGEVCMAVKEVAQKHASFNIVLNKIAYGPEDKIPPRAPKFLNKKNIDNNVILENENADYGRVSMQKFKSPRYIWAGGEESKEASLLKEDLENALLEVVNFTVDNREFHLHITLARINSLAWRQINPEERLQVNEIIDLVFTVESIEVMESESVRGNLRYTVIESCQLN